MQTIFVRGMRLRLVFVVLVLLAFTCSVLAASSGKTIPFDEVNHRLETVLQELSRTARARPLALSQLAQDRGITLEGEDSITVVIEPVSGNASRIDRAMVRALGGTIEATSKNLMRVRVPINRLETMADQVNGIAFIRLPYQPRPLAITSEGIALTGASDFHTAGYYGQGTKVAIIDLGFIGLTTAQAAGELDNVVYTHDYTGGGLETYTKHGTGVAEVVADMAPQASLYLLMIGDSVDLQNAADYCITNGIDIINHSVGWYNSNYYDGTGTVAGIANNARDNGILWVNAAGNEASDGHWQGTFVDSDGDSYLDFGSGSDFVDGDAIDEGNRIYASAGDTIYVYMTWDDWTASNQDYDLHLYNSFGAIIASSTYYQSGTQHPTEYLVYNVASSGNYEIVIENYNAPTTPNIEFFAFTNSGASLSQQYHHPESTIITPANSAKVLTAGAIYRGNWTTGPQESFSSQGPSNASKYAVSITKPDVMGPDGVLSYTYGNFYGTSAASPHVAGAAALLLSENPTRTADQLQVKLEGDAIDMGTAGKDNIYGSGRLNLVPGPAQDLVGYWQFNEGSGTTVGDSSGNSNDGTIHGASWVSGSPDGSTTLSFDGVNDCVEVSYSSSLNPSNALTIEAWIKPGVLPGGQSVIVEKPYTAHAYPYYQYSLMTLSSDLKFVLTINGALKSVRSSSTGLTVGSWYHVAGVYDGQYLKIYINGVLKGSANVGAGTISGYGTNLYMARHGNVTSEKFKGTIDEVQIYNWSLDPTEFNLLPAGPTPPALVTDFTASDGEDSQSTLTWTNPNDADLAQVVVQRKTGSYPANHTDGTTVYNNTSPTPGAAINTADTGLINGTTYYYAVFSRDTDNNWNDTVQAGSNADIRMPSVVGGPVGYWCFNEGSGTTVGDSSGNSNDGTIHGASWVSGSPDGSTTLSFDGVNDCVEVSYSSSLNPSNALTIEAWIKPGVLPGGQSVIVEKPYTAHAYPYYQYSLMTLSSDLKFVLTINGALKSVRSSSTGLTVGSWYHVAGVYDGQYLKIYINGVLKGSANVGAGTISGYGTNLYMARHGNVTSEKFKGTIDEVQIYNWSLDPTEFNLLPAGPTPPALVTDFTASDGEDSQSTLTWTNPNDADLAQVVVQRKTGSYPANHTDGTTVYNNTSPTPGAAINTADTGLINGTTYYYAVFSRDTDNNWNDTVQAGSNADIRMPSVVGGPVGYWCFNEGSGTTVGDSSGNSNDGTIHGASWVSGSPDGSTTLSFDGVNDCVEVSYSSSLNPSNALTIEAWIKPGVLPGGQSVIVEKPYTAHAYPYYQYSLMTLSSDLKFVLTINGALKSVRSSSTGLTVGSWYHVAGVYDGQYLKIYINGVLKGSANVGAGTISGYGTNLYMARHGNVTSEKFKGTIDEVQIYNWSLDPTEFNLLPARATSALMSIWARMDGNLVRPNPVREAPAVFQVDGSDITMIAVRVYDLSGRRVYDSNWQAGNTLSWQLDNDRGELLANGAYLYTVQVKTESGEEERSKARSLVILR